MKAFACFSSKSLKSLARGSTSGSLEATASREPSGTDERSPLGNLPSAHWSRSLSKWSLSKLGASSPQRGPKTPPSSLCEEPSSSSAPPRPSMEPVMERTHSALNDLEAVQYLLEDLSHRHWRAANAQDQERLERVEQHELKPLVALGEGGFGSVNLCRVPASSSTSAFAALGAQQGGTPDRTSPAAAQPEAEDGADSEQRQADSSASTSGSGDVQVKVRPSLNDPQLIVAVKRVPLGWNQERELMQLHRCQQCPFIVRLFGFVEDGGGEHCSYIMEWAEGGDLGGLLQSLMERRGPSKQRLLMAESSARYYVACLLMALDFLHSNNLLHRDIKPSNLLLTSDGTAKLADLGFTVMLDQNGQTVGCCGTTGYMAPEVWAYGSSKQRMSYGVTADMWSLGATLYQMLSGKLPADHPDAVLKPGWRPPVNPRFSPPLQDLLDRLLAVKPQRRPQGVAHILKHKWFEGFDWPGLSKGTLKAPYVPSAHRPLLKAMLTGSGSVRERQQDSGLSAGGSSGLPSGKDTASRGSAALSSSLVPQRSAVSGHGEGSVRRGREGLRCSGSLDLGTAHVPVAEATVTTSGPPQQELQPGVRTAVAGCA